MDGRKIRTPFSGALMQIYYPSLQAIEQQTSQLDHAQCHHCKQPRQLVSHGFIRRKRSGDVPAAIGKRVWCSNRHRRTGCGRTLQLYLDSTLRRLHYTAEAMEALLLALLAGVTIQCAYHQATGTAAARNAYRWLRKLAAQASVHRSLAHQPLLPDATPMAVTAHPSTRQLLMSTVTALLGQCAAPLCTAFQRQWQRPFV